MLALCLVLAVGGCASSESREILEVVGRRTSTELVVTVDSCHLSPTVAVSESPDEVRMIAHVTRQPFADEDDCADSAHVRLSNPLGDRVVIDGSTDKRFALIPPD